MNQGWRSSEAAQRSNEDAVERYLDPETDGIRTAFKDVPPIVLEVGDPRLTIKAEKELQRQLNQDDEEEAPKPTGWIFKIDPDEAERQLEAGEDRAVPNLESLEWVHQNLFNRNATPAKAPDNGAWYNLMHAANDPKAFQVVYQRAIGKREDESKLKAEQEAERERQCNLLEEFGHHKKFEDIATAECIECGATIVVCKNCGVERGQRETASEGQ
jgi:hypothetical protein